MTPISKAGANRLEFKHLPALAFGAAALVTALLGWVLYDATVESRASATWITHTLQVVEAIDDVTEELNRAELSQRGYLLTGVESFGTKRDVALSRARTRSDDLKDLTIDNADQQRRISQLQQLVTERISIMQESVRLREDAGVNAAIARVVSGSGQQAAALVYEVAVGIKQEELRLLGQRRASEQPRYRTTLVLLLAGVLASLVVLGYLGFATQSRRREALLHEGALQRAIFNSANFSSIATDAKGVIQIFNVGAERMLGYQAAEVVNKTTPAEISDPQELLARASALSRELSVPIAPGFEALSFKAARGLEDIYELTYVRKDGTRLPAVVSVTALRDHEDAVIGYLLIGTDNTERRKIEAERVKLDEELREQNVELQNARVVAEKANLAKSEFLSSMSHELRSPLNAILGFGQLMETDVPPPSPAQLESIHHILKAGWHLLQLVTEILDLAKIESGKLSLSPESVSLAEVLDECRSMIEGQAQKRTVQTIFPRFEAPSFLFVDRTRLKQVLLNLLANAVKYNRAQGTVEIICAPSATGRVRISIRDTGEGLSPEKLAQLFQPFNRLGQEAQGEEGTGIGLVVAKQLTELMGGVIGVESTVGVGSVFWIDLMIAAEPQFAAGTDAPVKAVAHAVVHASAHRRTLLYVEDNPANLRLVEQLVARRPGLQLLSAVTGTRGVAIAREERPDLILMDINLPDISGLEALRLLRTDPTTAHIPIIALSANAMPHDIERGLQAGFFRYLTKPIQVDAFMGTLNDVLALAEPAVVPS